VPNEQTTARSAISAVQVIAAEPVAVQLELYKVFVSVAGGAARAHRDRVRPRGRIDARVGRLFAGDDQAGVATINDDSGAPLPPPAHPRMVATPPDG